MLKLLREPRAAARLQVELGGRRPPDAHQDRIAIDAPRLGRTDAARGVEPGDVERRHCTVGARDGLVRRRPGDDGHAGLCAAPCGLAIAGRRTQVDDGGDQNPLRVQIQTDRIRLQIGGHHDHPASGSDPVALQQTPCARCQQHARQIIVAEHRGLLDDAGGEHHRLGTHFGHARRLRERHPMIGVVAGRHRRAEHGDARRADDGLGQCAQRLVFTARAADRGTAQPKRLIDQCHARACRSRLERCREAARSAADHQHIAEPIALRRQAPLGLERHRPQSGDGAEHALPAGKQALRMKRLVIEPHRQPAREAIQESRLVGRKAAEGVDRGHPHAFAQQRHVAAHVGHPVDLKQRVAVVIRKRQDAARPVVLEAAAEVRRRGGRKRRRNGIAAEAAAGLSLEGEIDHRRSIDPFLRMRLQPIHHDPRSGGMRPGACAPAARGDCAPLPRDRSRSAHRAPYRAAR